MNRLLAALRKEPLDRPPIWIMRQAGRYLPEYRELRERSSFPEAVRSPQMAAEITLQPLRRFALDAAIVFQDIMTPLEALGVEVSYDPGPRLQPLTLEQVADLPALDPERVSFVGETIGRVRAELPGEVAVIGFAGAPITLLAYLLEGGSSRRDFSTLRSALIGSPRMGEEALQSLARSMGAYLSAQVEAGADVVQLFDSHVGVLCREEVAGFAVPAALETLQVPQAPTLYFAPRAAHALDLLPGAGADAYGVDWRLPLDRAWELVGPDRALQGNLDPAALLTDPSRVRRAARDVLEQAAGRPGHIFNLGHGILPDTPIENVQALVEAVSGSTQPVLA